MKNQLSKIRNGLLTFLIAGMAGMSAHADDTEIFFSGSNTSHKPNILFVLDTSGSMSGIDVGSTTSRMDRMKSAFTSLMDGLNNVNVGIMRFNDPGGPILYPVTNIDAPVTATTTVIANINTSTDDSEQATSTGTVSIANTSLAMTTRTSSGGSTLTKRVSTGNDDGEETVYYSSINSNSNDLEMGYNDYSTSVYNEQSVGTIFRGLAIPKNAVILNATVEFTVYANDNNSRADQTVNLLVKGQQGSSLPSFGSVNIGSRAKTTAATSWSITDPQPPKDETVTSPNLAAVVQELVNDSTWASGRDIALFFYKPSGDTSTGSRRFYAYDKSSSKAPLLTVSYEVPSAASTQYVGLRYSSVAVPRGASITSAYLEFTAAGSNSATAVYTINGEASGASAALASTANNLSPATRPRTSAAVSWTPTAWVAGQTYSTMDQSADLKTIVQEIVNRSDWCGRNAMTLLLSGSGTRMTKSYEASPSLAPKLNIVYDPSVIATGGGCMASDLSYRISGNNDDASVITTGTSSGTQDRSNSALYLGVDASTPAKGQAVGLRFTNVQIPKNATVLSAYIEFRASATSSGASALTLVAQEADTTVDYDAKKVTDASRTYSSVTKSWAVESWTNGVTYSSVDIKELIQPIVNRSGWAVGNSIALKITGTGTRRADSRDGNPANAPRLVLRIASNSAASTTTTRDVIKSMVNDLRPAGYTPIVDTLYEAALYYKGNGVAWGRIRGDAATMRSGSSDRRYFRLSHVNSYTGGTQVFPSGCSTSDLNSTNCVGTYISGSPVYKSPIVDQCQPNHIVFLTDGEATQNQSKSLVASMTGKDCSTSGLGSYEQCAIELAEYLATNDQSSLTGGQIVKTHTIAFNLDDSSGFLSKVAASGKGHAKSAKTSDELLQAFREIFDDIVKTDTTFVSPGVTVNAFNRLTHRNEIYFALFKPETKPYWPGNLKKYTIRGDGTILDAHTPAVDAIDDTTGFFKDTAKSYWSSFEDGNSAELGGAAEKLPAYATRKVLTYYTGSASTTLTATSNVLTDGNTAITKSRLGISAASDAYRTNLINWARGKDVLDQDTDGVTDEDRKQLSDPLHSVPHLVTYGGTDASPDITIFYGDNEGFLHAINGTTGVEHFAFIPEELLPNLDKLYQNSQTTHPYGLDSPANTWLYDVDNDAQIEPADGDKVYVYIGMGRGGRNYYAIDATDRSAPKFLWKITGGSGDFAELGETWARPIKTRINVNGTVTDVLIISGGYDADQDNATVRTVDDQGRAIFIVNATTGALIWSAGPSAAHKLNLASMKYSIPSTVRAIDINNDKLADQLYVGDMGGQLWRFDIANGQPATSLVTGGVIADVGGTTAAQNRRFYHEPDVSPLIEGNSRKLAVALGSGYRGHPLNETIVDRFYLFKQSDVYGPPADGPDADTDPDYVKMTEASLYDATNNLIGEGTAAQQAAALTSLTAASGWYITMTNSGEKVLSAATTYSGEVFFTTYSPQASIVGCSVGNGTSRLYRVKAADATPAVNIDTSNSGDLDPSTTLTKSDRVTELSTSGIAADPQILRLNDGNVVCVGTECSTLGDTNNIIKTYWYTN